MIKKNKFFILACLLIILLSFIGIFFYNKLFVLTNDAVIEQEFVVIDAVQSGKLKELYIKPNQNVHKGQLLAEIEVIENIVTEKKAASDNTLESSKSLLNKAEETYKKHAIMYKDGVISQDDYDKSLNQLTEAQADYDKALKTSKNLDSSVKTVIKKNISTSKVYSPKDGIVSLSYVNKGENAIKDAPLILLDSNVPKVTAYFNPKFANNLNAGQQVDIFIKNYPLKKIKGVIDRVSPEPEINKTDQSLVIPVNIIIKENLDGYDIENGQPVVVKFRK